MINLKNNIILVKPLEVEDITNSGLVIDTTEDKSIQMGVVLQNVTIKDGDLYKDINEGNKIAFDKHSIKMIDDEKGIVKLENVMYWEDNNDL